MENFRTGLAKTMNSILNLTLFAVAIWTRWPLEVPFNLNFPVNPSFFSWDAPQMVSIFSKMPCLYSDIELQLSFQQKLFWVL